MTCGRCAQDDLNRSGARARGEDLALSVNSTFLSNGREQSVSETEAGPPTRGRTGVAIGILVVTLLTLAFYFYWRTTGMRDKDGRRPSPAREMSATPATAEVGNVG
jgi:hypothetical protein